MPSCRPVFNCIRDCWRHKQEEEEEGEDEEAVRRAYYGNSELKSADGFYNNNYSPLPNPIYCVTLLLHFFAIWEVKSIIN
uniref:Uncharacterized protein n=1 Tax=Caenorhabditis tropicalis TaxID=1561998 RepID=A0A1I7TDP1_9PELO